MSPGAEAKSFDELISSAAATVTGEDVAKAQESSTNMQQHAENLDMLQFRMFAADK